MSEPRRVLRYLSLGAGVQSTTLALMIAHGEVEMVDCAIFSDTQWEPKEVYRHLDWLEKQLPFPVYRVTAGSLRQHVIDGVRSEAAVEGVYRGIPAYTRQSPETMEILRARWQERLLAWESSDPMTRGRAPAEPQELGMLRRQCTREFKIAPITAKVRELVGVEPGVRMPRGVYVEQLTGISSDEADRAKPAEEKWVHRLYPLLDRRITRMGCIAWMRAHGYPDPPRSACLGCPLHSNAEWKRLRASDPDGWADAVGVDEAIRYGVHGPTAATSFLHRRGLPLVDAVEVTTEQADLFDKDRGGWGNECEGMCGV